MLCAAPSLRADEPREAELDVTDPFDIATAGADSLIFVSAADTLQQPAEAADSMPARKPMDYDALEEREVQFNPDPTSAVWM